MTTVERDGRFRLGDEVAARLARQFGTPLYVIDEAHLRGKIRRYVRAFRAAFPKSELTFASKANSTLAVLKIAHQEGLLIDAASEGELRAAFRAGVPANRCHLHGNNKSLDELRFAFDSRVNQIVVDNFEEIEAIQGLGEGCPDLVLRLAPGVNPHTHAKISTGQADTKFGFNIADGSAERALLRCLELQLPVKGFHCHVGSQLLDPGAQVSGGEALAEFAVAMLKAHGFRAEVINVGGGLGIHYVEGGEPLAVERYCELLAEPIKKVLDSAGLEPLLVQEPGRSIIGESGVTLYEVGVVKTVPSREAGQRTYVVVDGGLSDNPRPVMYGSKYTVELVPSDGRPAAPLKRATVSGKHCETDRLFEDVPLPGDVKKGDLIQVLCTGAYNNVMASNYNRFRRPATVLIRPDGSFLEVQRRETVDDLLARESVPDL